MQQNSSIADKVQTTLGALLILCVVLNFSNVVARYGFNTALLGIEELQVYLLVGISFFGAVVVSWRREHLRMDALVGYMRPRTRRVVSVLEELAMAGLLGFAAVQSSRYSWQMAQINRKSDLMEIPMWIPHGCVTVGLALMALLAVYRLVAERAAVSTPLAAEAKDPAGEVLL